jgi:RimJ/RimL family protein N-acetyltransferase
MSPLLPETNAKGENYAVLLRTPLAPEIINSRGLASDQVLVPGGFLGWVGTWRSGPVPEVGLIFHRACWGLGFATEALEAFLKVFWANRPEFELLDAWCDTENIASQNVLKKCRFALVESVTGDYTLPWMVPALRSSLRFQIRRSMISPGDVGKED